VADGRVLFDETDDDTVGQVAVIDIGG